MKTKLLNLFLCVQALFTLPGCALAQAVGARTPVTVRAFVHDPDGKPVEGARVGMATPYYSGRTEAGAQENALTDKNGVATVTGAVEQEYMIGADKAGYYHTTGPRRGIDTGQGFARYATGTQQIDLELRPIKKPTHGITKAVGVEIPVLDKPLGFDLEVGELVAPYGKGRVSDLIFKLTGHYNGPNDYDQTLSIAFSNPGDGLMFTKVTPRLGSEFKLPYEAPLTGYQSQRTWRKANDGKNRVSNLGVSDETHYLFRVRSQPDSDGKVRFALHGAITSEITFGGSNTSPTRSVFGFTYILNPDWTRNLEFDSKQRALAGTGKLFVAPPPNQ